MDTCGTFLDRPVILVVHQFKEMENMIRAGILSCPSELEFCCGLHDQVIHHIEFDHPGLLISPLQLADVNAADLVQELINKTGTAIPGIFITDPKYYSIQQRLESMGSYKFLPRNFTMQDLLQNVAQMGSPKREHRHETGTEASERKKSTAA